MHKIFKVLLIYIVFFSGLYSNPVISMDETPEQYRQRKRLKKETPEQYRKRHEQKIKIIKLPKVEHKKTYYKPKTEKPYTKTTYNKKTYDKKPYKSPDYQALKEWFADH